MNFKSQSNISILHFLNLLALKGCIVGGIIPYIPGL
jgi:hypothetical protein